MWYVGFFFSFSFCEGFFCHSCFQEEDDDDEEEGSEEEADGEEGNYPTLPQVGTILYRDVPQSPQQPPLPPSPQAQPKPPPPPLQAAFVPIQPLPDYNPADYPGSTSPELQRVLVGQQMLGQQQQGQQLPGLGPGMIPQQAPDGLMVATPAQTLTDTLDDIMAGEWGRSCCPSEASSLETGSLNFLVGSPAAVSSRVPMLNTTTSPTPMSQPPTQMPANIAPSPSVLPLYPSVDIDAHVSSSSSLKAMESYKLTALH